MAAITAKMVADLRGGGASAMMLVPTNMVDSFAVISDSPV